MNKSLAGLAILAVAILSVFAGTGARAEARGSSRAHLQTVGGGISNFAFFDGYPKELGKFQILKHHYEGTQTGTLTIDGDEIGISCEYSVPQEDVVINTETGRVHFTNTEEWACEAADGRVGELTLRNIGRGTQGEGFTALFIILNGNGLFDGARGAISNSSSGVDGSFRLTGH